MWYELGTVQRAVESFIVSTVVVHSEINNFHILCRTRKSTWRGRCVRVKR
jgi:hypothetical protein